MYEYTVRNKKGETVAHGIFIDEVSVIVGYNPNYIMQKLRQGRNEFRTYTIEQTNASRIRYNLKQVSEEDAKRMYEKYKSGMSIERVAASERRGQATVRKVFEKYNFPLRNSDETSNLVSNRREKKVLEVSLPREEDPFYDNEIRDLGKVGALRKAGWTILEISKEFVSTEREVRRCLGELNMK